MEYLVDLKSELTAAKHGEKGRIMDAACEFLGVSRQQMYRLLRDVGFAPSRKRRSDYGRLGLNAEQTRSVAGLLYASRRKNGKVLLSMSDATQMAKDNGLIPESVTPRQARQAMIHYRCTPEQLARPTAHRVMRSLHPNHVWQFDPSVCVMFYMPNGGMRVMSEKAFYKNKPQNVAKVSRDRIWRYVATDHASGSIFVRYYLTPGETQEILFEFLMEAFAAKGDIIMHGVPQNLIWDAGSANTAHAIQNMLDALGVDHQPHLPGNPRAKGQVEGAQQIIERSFEGRLAFVKVEGIEHLNELADTWQVWFNGTQEHKRHRKTRYAVWQTIRQEQLILPPSREICQQLLMTKPQPRKVSGDLTISYSVEGQSRTYSVEHIEHLCAGDGVMVTINPYRVPNVYVIYESGSGEKVHVECTPVAKDDLGFPVDSPVWGEYQGVRASAVDVNRDTINQEAWGATAEHEIEKKRTSERAPAFGGTIDPFKTQRETMLPAHMKRPGTPLEMRSTMQVEDKPLTHIETVRWLRHELHRAVTPAENQLIRETYPEGVPEDELHALKDRLAAQPVERPKLKAI